MSIEDELYIRPIDYATAQYYIEKFHYLHRASMSSYSYGLFKIENGRLGEMIGVATYGTPCSPSLCKGICGEDESDQVIELTRLWTKDDTPKNAESFFVGNTIKRVPYDIIVSFADKSVGHAGYIYQATNWIYTGLSAKRTERIIKGENIHCRGLYSCSEEELKKRYGDKFMMRDRPRKHRYIYFNCNKRRKRELKKKLKYPIKSYPKLGDN